MAEKRWDDYWKRYNKGTSYSPKPVKTFSAVSGENLLRNRWIWLSVFVLVATLAIVYVGFQTGNYIRVLEMNKTRIQLRLDECMERVNSLTDSLTTCNSNLDSKSQALERCIEQRESYRSDYRSCLDRLNEKSSALASLEDDYNECKDDLSDCKDDLSDCRHDLNSYKTKYNTCKDDLNTTKYNYAKDYCCLLNETWGNITSWRFESGKVICTNSTNDTQLVC